MNSFSLRQMWFVLAVAVITVTICFSIQPAPDEAFSDEESISEEVFRYQLEHIRLKNMPQLYFFSLGEDKDPTNEFLRRFESSSYLVKKYSESVYKSGRVTEKSTGRPGIRLVVNLIKRTGNLDAEVQGSWFAGFEDYQEQVFRVKKEEGKWLVKEVRGTLDP